MPFVNRIGSGATRKFGFGAGMKPGAPTSVVGTAGNTQVSVAFTEPELLGTGTISYTATSSPGSFTASGASSPLVVTGLSNGTPYTFTVTATNAFGSSTSTSSSAVTPATVPSQPNEPIATRGDTQVSLTWTAPANGGSAITDYNIQYSSNSGSTWTTFNDGVSTATSATVTGLTNGTTYVFKIRAVNIVGPGSYSAPGTSAVATPAGVPAAQATPTASLPATYGNTTALVSWTAPSSNGSAITDYTVQYSSNSGSSWTTFADGTSTTTSTTVTGLSNGTAYVFRVAAVNTVGTGAFSSNSNSVTPLFGKIATPVVSDIAETTSTIPLCYDNYASQSQADGYVYNYYNYNVVPNDQSGSCHGWTGLGENVNRFTYVYLSKTGWANSDSIYLEETTNVTPATTTTTTTTTTANPCPCPDGGQATAPGGTPPCSGCFMAVTFKGEPGCLYIASSGC